MRFEVSKNEGKIKTCFHIPQLPFEDVHERRTIPTTFSECYRDVLRRLTPHWQGGALTGQHSDNLCRAR